MNATKGNVELRRHYEIFTLIWYFNFLSIFTPSLIHLSVRETKMLVLLPMLGIFLLSSKSPGYKVAVKPRITSVNTLGVSLTLPFLFIHCVLLGLVESFVIDPLNYLQSHLRHILLLQAYQMPIYQQSLSNLYHLVFEVMFCSYHTTASEKQIFSSQYKGLAKL